MTEILSRIEIPHDLATELFRVYSNTTPGSVRLWFCGNAGLNVRYKTLESRHRSIITAYMPKPESQDDAACSLILGKYDTGQLARIITAIRPSAKVALELTCNYPTNYMLSVNEKSFTPIAATRRAPRTIQLRCTTSYSGQVARKDLENLRVLGDTMSLATECIRFGDKYNSGYPVDDIRLSWNGQTFTVLGKNTFIMSFARSCAGDVLDLRVETIENPLTSDSLRFTFTDRCGPVTKALIL